MQVKISGPGVSTKNIPVDTLINVLQVIKKSTLMIYESKTKGAYATDKPSQAKKGKVPLSIVGISEGSANLEIAELGNPNMLFDESTPAQIALKSFIDIVEAVENKNEAKVLEILPFPGPRKAVMKQFDCLLDIQRPDLKVSFQKDDMVSFTPVNEWRTTINSLKKSKERLLELEMLGSVTMVHTRKFKAEFLAGEKNIYIKNPDIGQHFKKFYDKNVYVRGTVKVKPNSERILMGIEELREFKKEIKISSFSFEGKLYKFSSSFLVVKEIDSDGSFEIKCPELKIFGFGERFEDAWYDFKRAFATAIFIVKNSEIPLADSEKEFADFVNSKCEVSYLVQ